MRNLRLLLYSTATSDTENHDSRAGLEQFRNLSRLHANSFPVLQFALVRVNSVFWKGLDNVIDSARTRAIQMAIMVTSDIGPSLSHIDPMGILSFGLR